MQQKQAVYVLYIKSAACLNIPLRDQPVTGTYLLQSNPAKKKGKIDFRKKTPRQHLADRLLWQGQSQCEAIIYNSSGAWWRDHIHPTFDKDRSPFWWNPVKEQHAAWCLWRCRLQFKPLMDLKIPAMHDSCFCSPARRQAASGNNAGASHES